MNLFLMAPGVLLVLWLGCGLQETVVCLVLCALVQVLVGLPFLSAYPVQYISRAFEFSRVFKHEWTVNLKFLDEAVFVSSPVSLALLLCTVLAFLFFARKWLSENVSALHSRGFQWWRLSEKGLGEDLSPSFIVTTIFASNFVGVAFARTLHYQFYCWYFHTLPWLLWHTHMPTALRLVCMALIEAAFNVFPATPMSSAGLQVTAATPGITHLAPLLCQARPVTTPTHTILPSTYLKPPLKTLKHATLTHINTAGGPRRAHHRTRAHPRARLA
jgi:alpha-1,3-mannosyltransferase